MIWSNEVHELHDEADHPLVTLFYYYLKKQTKTIKAFLKYIYFLNPNFNG